MPKMQPLPERILALIEISPGLTDRDVTDFLIATGAPQQQVNQTCRRLESQGRLLRSPRDDGKVGNFPLGTDLTRRVSTKPQSEEPSDTRMDNEPLRWSDEIQLEPSMVTRAVPRRAGVYQILQSTEYPRYAGTTRVLKIGKSLKDLCSEVSNHFQRHTVANRLNHIRARRDLSVTIIFAETAPDAASRHEQSLLRSFEDKHWDLPVLNSQRGYERGSDAHYREPVDGAVV